MGRLTFILILLSLSLTACDKERLAPRDYAQFVENIENGLRIETHEGDLFFDLQYKPVDYVLVNELKKDAIEKGEYETTRKELEGMVYFNLKISQMRNGQRMDVTQRNKGLAQYLQFSLRPKIKLKIGDQLLSCAIYHYENGQGIKPYSTIVLGFEYRDEINEALDLTIEKDDMLGNGPVHFIIAKEYLENIPNLKIS